MILLLGGSGYIGQMFQQKLTERGHDFHTLSRQDVDYTRFDVLYPFLRWHQPEFVINASGFTGKPNVDVCELNRADTLMGNVITPNVVANACVALNIPLGQISSGCIYSGDNGGSGYTETDPPNFCYRQPPCSFYSGAKALSEEALSKLPGVFLWRLRLPFDEFDNPRNYLTKLQTYPRVYEATNSISHRGEFVAACLDLWTLRSPAGIYNMTNTGVVKSSEVVELIRRTLKIEREFDFWASDEEFYLNGNIAPRSNCVLNTDKLASAGVPMRNVWDALEDALGKWTFDKRSLPT